MPIPSPTLTNSERKAMADRLWRIIAMCDEGATLSSVREAVRFTAYAVEESSWDRRLDIKEELAAHD